MDALPSLDLGLGPTPPPDLEFVYVGDPMCSWCWGFAPALERLEERYAIPLRVVMGGLRTGQQAEPMDAPARAHLAAYWQDVARRTGQPFTDASTERDGWRYDTEPSVFPDLLEGLDVGRERFVEMLADDATARRTHEDLAEALRYGATGFPTLLFRDGDDLGIVTRGFVPWEQLEPELTDWLGARYGDLTAGIVCDPATGLC